MSSSVHVHNKNKDTLILVKGPTRDLDDTTLTAVAEYCINFSRSLRKFCLNLHFHGSKSLSFSNATKLCKFKTKDSEIKKYPCI